MNSLPNELEVRFLKDSTEGKDGAKEVIMDHVISWMLRRAQNICSHEKPVLYRYCRKFLGKLIDCKLNDAEKVVVETWKQDYHIDIWAYIKVGNDEYDILIEDKYYTSVRGDQLLRYKKEFTEWLKKSRPSSKPIYWLLTCFESTDKDVYAEALKKSGFSILHWDEMLLAMDIDALNPVESECDIFNEFWLKQW